MMTIMTMMVKNPAADEPSSFLFSALILSSVDFICSLAFIFGSCSHMF